MNITLRSMGILILVALCTLSSAAVNGAGGIELSGWAWFTAGRFEKAHLEKSVYDGQFNETWTQDVQVGVKLFKQYSSNTCLKLHIGAMYQHPVNQWNNTKVTVTKTISPYLIEASLKTKLFEDENLRVDLNGGFFPIKYNSYSQNLGEYLFRSGTYPPYLVSGFELADKVKALGVGFEISYKDLVDQTVLIKSEHDMFPLYDISLAYLADVKTPFIDAGVGAMLARFISVDERNTIPAKDTINFDLRSPAFHRLAVIDSIPGDTSSKDTILLTHAGAKLMAHFAVRPFAQNSEGDFFRKEDMALYGEIALLGVKNYPQWYEDRTKRLPAMLGINIPTHPLVGWGTIAAGTLGLSILQENDWFGKEEIYFPGNINSVVLWSFLGVSSFLGKELLGLDTRLDRLSFELEWYGNEFINSPQDIIDTRSPVPYTEGKLPEYDKVTKHHEDDWKWSLYASKKIGTIMKISGQISNDNLSRSRFLSFLSDYPITIKPSDWYWMLRTTFFL